MGITIAVQTQQCMTASRPRGPNVLPHNIFSTGNNGLLCDLLWGNTVRSFGPCIFVSTKSDWSVLHGGRKYEVFTPLGVDRTQLQRCRFLEVDPLGTADMWYVICQLRFTYDRYALTHAQCSHHFNIQLWNLAWWSFIRRLVDVV